jgi:hypothetical protein
MYAYVGSFTTQKRKARADGNHVSWWMRSLARGATFGTSAI